MIRVTPCALTELKDIVEGDALSFVRIAFTPVCGGPRFSLSLDQVSFASDISITVDGVRIVHAKNLGHLLENVTVDLVETADGPDFTVHVADDPGC